jgi:ceramide glucosyltransferase
VLAFGHFNTAYLRQATPVHYLWAVPLLEIILPLQLLAAIGSRQRIVWREHVMQVERGGTFHFVRRSSRSSAESVGD